MRVNLGLNMMSELLDDEFQYLLPKLQNLDHFNFVYVMAHKFSTHADYMEPLLDKNWIPEPFPAPWHKIA